MTNEELKLFNELKKEINKANNRLRRLEIFSGKPFSWGGRKLYDILSNEKLNAISKNNRIIINKQMSEEQLKRIMWATREFLKAPNTTTVRGVKKRIKNIKSGFTQGIGVSEEQAEKIYQAFEDDIIKWALRYIDASELWALIEEAKESNLSEERFSNEFLKRAEIAGQIDADFKDLVNELYKQEVL